jgi:hypothetical protein
MAKSEDIVSSERIGVPMESGIRGSMARGVELRKYPFTMSTILKQGSIGKFAIEKTTISKGTVVDRYKRFTGRMVKMRCGSDRPVVKLTEDGNTWMSDNPFEVESIMGAVEVASGDVLTGGLGIGLLPTLINDKVTRIDIVELNQEVIDLVFHQVATEKMKIIRDDLFHYLKSTDKRYDFICIDVWQETLLPLLEIDEAKKLAQRCLKPGGTTWCWLQETHDNRQ